MLRAFKITQRFVGTTAVATALVLTLIFLLAFSHVKGILQTNEEEVLGELAENILGGVEAEGRRAQSMAALVGGIPAVQKAFAERDRPRLEAWFQEGFGRLKKDFGVRQFQFHEPPARSFLRVHKPAKFGDDLSSFRHTVVETNRSVKPIQGLEVGVAGLGVRGIVPVKYQGGHVGSVEFGLSLGQDFVNAVAAEHGVDLAVHLLRDGKMDTLATTPLGETMAEPALLAQTMDQGAQFLQTQHEDVPLAVMTRVFKDYSGNAIGVLTLVKDRSANQALVDNLAYQTAALALAGLVVLCMLTWFAVSNSVVKPLRSTTAQLRDIAHGSGNLASRLEVSGSDEIAELAQAYNAFVEQLDHTVRETVSTTSDVANMTRQLSGLAADTQRGTLSQQDQVSQVATAMTEMSATVHDVAHNTANTAEAATRVDEQSADGQKIVHRAVDSINALASEVGQAVERVRAVEKDSERIGSVLDVIRGIAEQTNLLALNAAIEAARAGEQGRGFAVVADEVRTLASRTQDSTQEIQHMIESLQAGVKQTASTLETNQHKAGDSVAQAEQALEALVAITGSIDTITAMSGEIATAAEEQSAVAEDINRNVVEITGVAEMTSGHAQQSLQASEQLATDVQRLVELMGQFRTS